MPGSSTGASTLLAPQPDTKGGDTMALGVEDGEAEPEGEGDVTKKLPVATRPGQPVPMFSVLHLTTVQQGDCLHGTLASSTGLATDSTANSSRY